MTAQIKLYHFTRPDSVESIKENGIIYGDVPTTPTDGFNAPWLTNNPNHMCQDWEKGTGKNLARFTVLLDYNDPKLHRWSDWAVELEVEQWWYDILNKTGGGEAHHWFVYEATIPSVRISGVKVLA